MKYKSAILIGPPGTGKTSVGHILDKLDGYKHYSNGEELRKLILQDKLNSEIAKYMNQGLPIPAKLFIPEVIKIVQGFIEKKLYNPKKDILLLDGLPRDEKQLIELKKYFEIYKAFVFYANNDKLLFKRINNQRVEQRIDDFSPEIIKKRIEVVNKELNFILSFFKKEQIVKVDSENNSLNQMANIIVENI